MLLVFCPSLALEQSPAYAQTPRPAQIATQEPAPQTVRPIQRYDYMGTSPCSVAECHGSVSPKQATEKIKIARNEYYTWLKQDKHAKAYEVLLKDRSVQIAQNLKLGERADESARCLACHAIQAPAGQRGKYFKIEEGVSCEACHGAAQKWLRPHQKKGYEVALQLGMVDTRNLLTRAEVCVSCHIGNTQKSVSHELIAAGHPALVFELDTFTALMPPHWHRTQEEWAGVQAWSLGQAVTLRETAERLAQYAQPAEHTATAGWPEFSEFDCFSCHHLVQNLTSSYYTRTASGLLAAGPDWTPSWRQARGHPGGVGGPGRGSIARP